MPETETTAAPAPESGSAKLAGKYDTPDALAAGFRELNTKLGLPDIPKERAVFGKDGIYADEKALETAYKAHEGLLGKITKADKPAGESAPATLSLTPDLQGYAKVMHDAGLSGKERELASRFDEKGELTEDQYKSLEKAGRSREEIDNHFKGLLAIARERNGKLIGEAEEIAGGTDQLKALRSWAAESLPKEKVAAWNKEITDKPENFPAIVRQINHEYQKQVDSGNVRPLIGGTSVVGGAGAKDGAEFSALVRRAERGDKGAMAKITATPQETIDSWKAR